jgi:hypothetical protein
VTPEPLSGRPETPEERADRNLSDLLQELRVALPGVQVLFAFLLTVPFSQRFDDLTPFQEKLYFGILCGAALSTALFIAPTAGHRLLFRRQQKEYLVVAANPLTLIGLAVLAVSMAGVIALISDLMFGATATVITTSAALIVFAALWFAGPLLRRRELEPLQRP